MGERALKWFEFNQNNSGGYFVVNDKVCKRLIIEAESFDEAVLKAEDLGCYWNGVRDGIDCPCCGDRWSIYNSEPIDLEEYSKNGREVEIYDEIYPDTIDEWNEKYGKYKIIEQPKFRNTCVGKVYSGKIRLHDIEEYAHFKANEYGNRWTTPDTRIYYYDGKVTEIFTD